MYDIIFISYNEPNADKNWLALKSRFPMAKRVHGIKGIHQIERILSMFGEVKIPSMLWNMAMAESNCFLD